MTVKDVEEGGFDGILETTKSPELNKLEETSGINRRMLALSSRVLSK